MTKYGIYWEGLVTYDEQENMQDSCHQVVWFDSKEDAIREMKLAQFASTNAYRSMSDEAKEKYKNSELKVQSLSDNMCYSTEYHLIKVVRSYNEDDIQKLSFDDIVKIFEDGAASERELKAKQAKEALSVIEQKEKAFLSELKKKYEQTNANN